MVTFYYYQCIFTPHVERERSKVIDVGVHMYICICLWTKKKVESYFSDRLTFSSIHCRTARRIYRLALPLRAPDTLSSRVYLYMYNAHLVLIASKR